MRFCSRVASRWRRWKITLYTIMITPVNFSILYGIRDPKHDSALIRFFVTTIVIYCLLCPCPYSMDHTVFTIQLQYLHGWRNNPIHQNKPILSRLINFILLRLCICYIILGLARWWWSKQDGCMCTIRWGSRGKCMLCRLPYTDGHTHTNNNTAWNWL